MQNNYICDFCFCPENKNDRIITKYFYKRCMIGKCNERGSHIHQLCELCHDIEREQTTENITEIQNKKVSVKKYLLKRLIKGKMKN